MEDKCEAQVQLCPHVLQYWDDEKGKSHSSVWFLLKVVRDPAAWGDTSEGSIALDSVMRLRNESQGYAV